MPQSKIQKEGNPLSPSGLKKATQCAESFSRLPFPFRNGSGSSQCFSAEFFPQNWGLGGSGGFSVSEHA